MRAALRRRSVFLSVLTLLVALFASRVAEAAASARADNATLTEADGRWKLKLTIDYGGTPDIQFVPMLFIFEPTMLYERSLTDESPEKPVVTKKPLQSMPTINESMDVGFSDGTGKVFKVTKFDFVIRRDRGFEAGEYKLTIKFADSGKTLGQPIRVVLNGDNVVVDRRSISFVGDKSGGGKKKPPPAPTGDGETTSSGDTSSGASDTPSDTSSASGGDAPADGDAGTVPPKQGGCGCKTVGVGEPATTPWALFGAAALGLAWARRRRRSS